MPSHFWDCALVKISPANSGDTRDTASIPGSARFPGEVNGNLFQCSCHGKSHEQRSLVGYSLWGPKESDNTQHAHRYRIFAFFFFFFPFLLVSNYLLKLSFTRDTQKAKTVNSDPLSLITSFLSISCNLHLFLVLLLCLHLILDNFHKVFSLHFFFFNFILFLNFT